MSDLEWWRWAGWRDDIVRYQVIGVGLAAAWLSAGLYLRSRDHGNANDATGGHGTAWAVPTLAWAATTVLQALAATQLDIISGSSRFPYYRASILVAVLSGALVTLASVAAFRLRVASSGRSLPSGWRKATFIAWATVVGTWCSVLLREVRLSPK